MFRRVALSGSSTSLLVPLGTLVARSPFSFTYGSFVTPLSRRFMTTTTSTGPPPPISPTPPPQGASAKTASINSVSLVGVAHNIESGFVFEEAVLQFTLTTTALQTNVSSASSEGCASNATSNAECVVERDHHVIRCFGEVFSQEVQNKIKEGSVVCVNGRLRLNPQLEPSVNKYYYFPYIQVQPPHGQVAVVYTDRTSPPPLVDAPTGVVEDNPPTKTGAPATPEVLSPSAATPSK